MMLSTDAIKCPHCGIFIRIPFLAALKAKVLEDYDMAEIDAQSKLAWLNHATLWQLFKFWRDKRNA